MPVKYKGILKIIFGIYTRCQLIDIFTVFLIIFVTIHPTLSTFPVGENQEKSHDFRQSVDKLFPRAIRCSIQGSNPCPKWWGAVA